MSESPFQFRCPHCAQLLEVEALPEGHLVQYSNCGEDIQLEPASAHTQTDDASPTRAAGADHRRLVPAVFIGAPIAQLLTRNLWRTLIGALFGFLVGKNKI